MGVFTYDHGLVTVDEAVRAQSIYWFVQNWEPLDQVDTAFDPAFSLGQKDMLALIESWVGQLSSEDGLDPVPMRLAKEPAKWAVMSFLQKGIRRGEPSWVYEAVSILHNSGLSDTAWRRLAVIGMEDLGLAALPVLAVCVAVVTKQVEVPEGLGWDLLYQVSKAMAESHQDRSLCDITGIGLARSDRYREATKDLKGMDATDWREVVIDRQEAVCRRVRSYQHLAQYSKNSGFLAQAEQTLRTPSLVRYVAHNYKIACKDPMWAALPVMWDLATLGGVKAEQVEVTSSPMVASMPSCVFDMFSYDGKRAFNYFKKSSALAKAFFSEHTDTENNMLGYAVFAVEGGNLASSLSFPMRDEIGYETLVDDFESVGLSIGEASELCTIVSEDLGLLDKARKAVIKDNLIEKMS